jgi:Flp pilus assembly protein TadD
MAAPYAPEMHYNFGVALGRAGRLAEAAGPLSRAVELDPNYAEAWMQLGEVFIGLGDYSRAEIAYRRLAELTPGHAPFLSRYAELLQRMGKNAEALARANQAMEADPNLPGPGVVIGRFYFESGDYASALAYFEREAELQPTSPEVFAFLSVLRMRTGDAEGARAAYRTYLSLGGGRDPAFEGDAGIGVE